MKKFWAGFFLAIFLSGSFALAQHLSRTTPIAGGPPGQGFLGDYDSGLVAVPLALTTVTTSTVLAQNIYCHNSDSVARTVTIQNTAGTAYVQLGSIGGASTVQFLNGGKGLQMVGIKWQASVAAVVNCQISGYL